MADGTSIEWTDATWQIVTGCSIVSPGCTNCYAMRLAGTRLRHHPSRENLTRDTKAGPVWTGEVRFNQQWLEQPLLWKRPRMIFVAAHGDLFHEGVEQQWLDQIFAVMALARQHQFQVLTKRPDRMASYVTDAHERILEAARLITQGMPPSMRDRPIHWPLRNVWLGASVEDQERADGRKMAVSGAASAGWLTWVSYEPALGPVDWSGWEFISWLVSGGESGLGARPSHPDWHRQTRDFCERRGIAYLFKQHGAWKHMPERAHLKEAFKQQWKRVESGIDGIRPVLMFNVGKKAAGRLLDGTEHNGFPRVAN